MHTIISKGIPVGAIMRRQRNRCRTALSERQLWQWDYDIGVTILCIKPLASTCKRKREVEITSKKDGILLTIKAYFRDF